jgi:putative mRNA 3-end processing factor
VNTADLLRLTPAGLYCEAGEFFVDPWKPVSRAIITHAHGDHARRGSAQYLTVAEGRGLLEHRMGVSVDTVPYGELLDLNGVRVSLHPAGHVLGSAQVRIEHQGQVWVVSGDYKTAADPTCQLFEPIRCDVFITESTFGLPIYRWPSNEEIFAEINAWWRANRDAGRASLLYGYALGKAQRLLAGVDASIGPIYTHGAVEQLNAQYRAQGVRLPPTTIATSAPPRTKFGGALVVAPPSSHGTAWSRRFGEASSAFASGWMRIRGARRRRAVDRGFVVSDHADWPGLLSAIEATGASKVLTTHGPSPALIRWLREHGVDAAPLETPFQGERDDAPEEAAEETEA